MSKKILISGGCGFIGSHLCDFFVKNGDIVWCIDNLITSEKKNIEHLLKEKNFIFIEKDLIYINENEIDEKFDYVLHLASPASPVDYLKYPIETLKVNSIGTEKMLNIALKSNSTFLFSSTSEVYGDPLIPVQDEKYWGNVNPIGLRSVYDEGKRYGEAIVMAYHRKYKLNTKIIRIFNTYGPRMRLNDGRVIPNFIYNALNNLPLPIYGDGKQTRSFCYIDDLIDGIIKVIEVDYNLPINLGNPEEFTIIELAEKIENIFGKKLGFKFLPPMPDDPRKRRPDITLAKKLLNWEPKIKLEDGLKRTISYFLNNFY
ncbi:MAG: SDR family oxidoreductase [Candidatus Omnitrophica bacterium]|nr:SDR family oxidoreductase [Candidatus Omnitrophota bacterium]MCM8809917.1 SDR family oxidoreductase [Candidatus Omnitrophota bacterium]MCM8811018.1 SDR family oxidoreductase [Candidatus Omnitrophota bacterium]MCM8833493.1 SDR family oxidoreductase [Candidatus Omnitrophota bacterium]